MNKLLIAVTSLILIGSACDKKAPEAQPVAPSPAAPSDPAAAPSDPAAAPDDRASTLSDPATAPNDPVARNPAAVAAEPAAGGLVAGKSKAVEPTAAEQLGTLPDGVGIPVGEVAPDVTFKTVDGEEVTLARLVEDKPLLLVFYRGGWCPFCNYQVHEFAKAHDALAATGVTVAFAAVDQPEGLGVTKQAYDVPFTLLSDQDATALDAFKVSFVVDDATLEQYAKWGLDLERWAGRPHHKLPIPSIFLIGQDRKVLWAHAAEDYKTRPGTEQVVTAITSVMKAPAE